MRGENSSLMSYPMQEKGSLVNQYGRERATDVGQVKYNGTQTGAARLYTKSSWTMLSALSWSSIASPRVCCFCVGDFDQSGGCSRQRNAEHPMGYLDELRKSTLVDSWSNRYGKSFHLNVPGRLLYLSQLGSSHAQMAKKPKSGSCAVDPSIS